jgi:4-amino-4-deoxy-L-arabinose transferase-like glycosyltransferase
MQTATMRRRLQDVTLSRHIPIPRPTDWTGVAVYLYGTICALLVSSVVYHSLNAGNTTIDLNGFGLLSRNIALGKGFTWGFGPTTRRAPLYPVLAAAILKVFGNDAPGVPDAEAYKPVLIAQCFVFGFTCLLAWAIARRLFGSRVALVTALLCPLLPQSLRFIAMTEVEILTGLFAVLLAYTGLNLLERPRLSTGVWFGLVAAADTLTKPVTQFYLVVFLALLWGWWIWRARREQQSEPLRAFHTRPCVVATCAALLVFGLAVLPWTIRNRIVTDGQFSGISSNASGEFLRGYINAQPKYVLLRQNFGGQDGVEGWDPEANRYEEQLLRQHGMVFYRFNYFHAGTVDVTPPIPTGVTSAQIEAQKDHVEDAVAISRVLHDPASFLGKFLVQLATFWYMVETRVTSLVIGGIALVILALSVLGILRARRASMVTWPVVAVILYLNVVYAATLAVARYSMPLYPMLLILAAGGLASLVPRIAPLTARLAPLGTRLTPLTAQLALIAARVEPVATRLFPSVMAAPRPAARGAQDGE